VCSAAPATGSDIWIPSADSGHSYPAAQFAAWFGGIPGCPPAYAPPPPQAAPQSPIQPPPAAPPATAPIIPSSTPPVEIMPPPPGGYEEPHEGFSEEDIGPTRNAYDIFPRATSARAIAHRQRPAGQAATTQPPAASHESPAAAQYESKYPSVSARGPSRSYMTLQDVSMPGIGAVIGSAFLAQVPKLCSVSPRFEVPLTSGFQDVIALLHDAWNSRLANLGKPVWIFPSRGIQASGSQDVLPTAGGSYCADETPDFRVGTDKPDTGQVSPLLPIKITGMADSDPQKYESYGWWLFNEEQGRGLVWSGFQTAIGIGMVFKNVDDAQAVPNPDGPVNSRGVNVGDNSIFTQWVKDHPRGGYRTDWAQGGFDHRTAGANDHGRQSASGSVKRLAIYDSPGFEMLTGGLWPYIMQQAVKVRAQVSDGGKYKQDFTSGLDKIYFELSRKETLLRVFVAKYFRGSFNTSCGPIGSRIGERADGYWAMRGGVLISSRKYTFIADAEPPAAPQAKQRDELVDHDGWIEVKNGKQVRGRKHLEPLVTEEKIFNIDPFDCRQFQMQIFRDFHYYGDTEPGKAWPDPYDDDAWAKGPAPKK